MQISIVNKQRGHVHNGIDKFYIGRGSPVGNPFTWRSGTKAMFFVKDREEAISSFAAWFEEQLQIGNRELVNYLELMLQALEQDGAVILICYCKPLACHGDVIKEWLREQVEGRS